MDFVVCPMSFNDIPQVAEIEQEAFPTQYSYTDFQADLQNKHTHYLVAYEEGKQVPVMGNFLDKMRGWFGPKGASKPRTTHYIVGMVGFWQCYEEAHIIQIAVKEAYRRQGIGELLLIAAIKKAINLGAKYMTLEVRVSNLAAQALYHKYGFKKVGVRPHYYSDNGEDGYIMTTDPLLSDAYQSLFQERLRSYQQRWQRPIKIIDTIRPAPPALL